MMRCLAAPKLQISQAMATVVTDLSWIYLTFRCPMIEGIYADFEMVFPGKSTKGLFIFVYFGWWEC